MSDAKVTFKSTKRISASAVQALFRRNRWYDWFTLADVGWYLQHALYVVTAWDGTKAVGLAALTGDGRINAWLDTLIVDGEYRSQGIGTSLTERIVARAEQLNPYYFQLDVYQEATERFYAQFGFTKNIGTWLLEHKPTANRLKAKAAKIRKGQKT